MNKVSENLNLSKSIFRFFQMIRLERKEITDLYIFAILSGFIQLSLPLGIQAIINFAFLATGGNNLPISMWVLIILVVLGVFLSGLMKIHQMKIVEKIQQKLFTRYAFEFTLRLPKINVQALEGYYLPELVNRFFDTITLQKSFSKLLLDIPTAIIQLIFGLILLSFYNPVFIVFGIVLLLILYVILYFSFPSGYAASLTESDYKYKVAYWIQEIARGVKSFKFFQKHQWHLEKTDHLVGGYLDARTKHFNVLKIQFASLVSFKILITAAMLMVGSILLIQQKINVGQFIAAEIIILMVITAVEKLIESLENIYDILTSLEKVNKVVEKPMESDGKTIYQRSGNGMRIAATELSFSFGTQPVLSDINFSISPGQKIAIMGDSDSGKTMLLRLMTGGYQNFKGSLLINNIPIANYDMQELRSNISVLVQKQDIFAGTLWENLTMGNERINNQQILNILSVVGLLSFFEEQSSGFDTPLQSTGIGLSTSVLQKILLARVLLQNSDLMLMDEPFASIPSEDRSRILEYIMKDTSRTVVFATQDDWLASHCDEKLYLKNGKIQ